MRKPILSFREYTGSVNEGFLESILNFFKGLFDLFNDKEVKKESKRMNSYFDDLIDDEDLEDDEIEEEVDVKRVRKSSTSMSSAIEKRIETDNEKSIATYKDLKKDFTSWIAMMITQQETLRMKIFELMLKDPNAQKRFTYVPEKYWEDPSEWRKDPDCKLDPKIIKSFENVLKASGDKKKEMITKFGSDFVDYVSDNEDLLDEVKSNNKEALMKIYTGLAKMAQEIITGANQVIKNTQDDKLAEMVSEIVIEERKRKPKSTEKKKEKSEDLEDEATEETSVRSRKKKKE